MPAFKQTRQEALQVAQATIDSYSHDTYKSWDACALALRNFTQVEATAILMSKHMRWAADASNKPSGECTSSDLLRYIADPRNAKWFTPKGLADLIAGK